MAVDTALGWTLTANPSSWSGNLIGGNLHEETIPIVDDSHMGTTGSRTKRAGDLIDEGSVVAQVQFNNVTALPAAGTTGTLTLTEAQATGESTAANWSGTAIVTRVNHGSRAIDELKTAEIEWTWDGNTGPTFTAAT